MGKLEWFDELSICCIFYTYQHNVVYNDKIVMF
jgi:hypothetical protein